MMFLLRINIGRSDVITQWNNNRDFIHNGKNILINN